VGGGRDREGCSLPNGIRTAPVTRDVVASSRDQPNKRVHSTNAGTVTTTHGLPRRITGNARAGLFLPHVWRRSRRSPSQRFASLSHIVNEFEEPEVEREFLLGNAPMRAKPTAQQRPEPFHRIHMDFTKAVAIVISGELAPAVVDTLMVVSPSPQVGINAIFIRVHPCSWINGVFDERFDRLLLHIGQQIDHHLTPALHHAKDGRCFLLQRATASFAFASASMALSTLALDYFGLPFMTGYS
jgi:hypothetical protein